MYSSWVWSMTDIVFCHFAYIFPFYPTNNPKNQNFERTKKMPGDIVILHLCTTNHMVYGSRDMECDRHIFRNCGSFFAWLLIYQPIKSKFWKNEKKECPEIFFVILGHILPFNPTKNHKIFEKMKKKKPGDTIILHKCIKNHEHMLYCSWDIASDGCNCYFSFWGVFCPFTPITAHKNQNEKKKKEKNARKYSSFYICSKNCDPMMYGSWVMVCNGPTDGQMDRKIYL